MLESFSLSENMTYQKLTPEEQASRGILGRLTGVIADFKHPTRNGRRYTEALWEKTFNDPIMQEKIENRCLFGELGHPTDRTEVLMEKIAICMAEQPKKSNGKLYGVFDILATPCGKILKTLCDYGCNIGISSRGTGETTMGMDGEEVVDADTFECECWDAVLIPAVKEARLAYVNESLSPNKTTNLKKALCEALDSSSVEDREIMENTLQELDIDYKPEKVDNIQESEDELADNNGSSLLGDLQEALKEKRQLEQQVATLQEKLSVSYTKEAELTESIGKYKSAIAGLTKTAKRVSALESKVTSLQEQLATSETTISSQRESYRKLQESHRKDGASSRSLNEELKSKDREISDLTARVSKLTESLTALEVKSSKTTSSLKENIEELKKDSAIKNKEYSRKIEQSLRLVEKYKGIANTAFGKYIESQAVRIGVSKEEIKNRLPEGCTFEDVDRICEELQEYRVNISRLPFDVSKQRKVKMQVKESKESIVPASRFSDEIDDQLLSLAGL